ncbi:MAG: hypothetical protein ABSH50_19020 [Bryobacteraceae bacterium]|jgi:hypothetical protein
MLQDENMGGFSAVNSRGVFGLNAREIKTFVPPGIHVGRAEPLLK